MVLDFIFGLILLLFALTVPGYALSVAFFPKKGELDTLERLTFSFAFSVAFVPLVILLEMQVLGWLLTPVLAWANFLIITFSGFIVYALRARRIPVPKACESILKPVKKGEGKKLFFEKWLK